MTYLLGIDISTTAAKALIIDGDGHVITSHSTPQKVSSPYPLWSEQDPYVWWDGVTASIRAALIAASLTGDDISGIGLTGQMHGLVLLDSNGEVLRPSILWNDQRTQAQCDEITERIGFHRLIELTGNRALTGFTAPKVLWVRQHEPEIYARAAQILLPKDYIRYRLSGSYATDLAGAAGTLLLNVAERRWSDEVLNALEIPAEWMPPVHEGTQVTSVVSEEAAAATGLKAGTPIVGGGGDQAAGAVGVGAVRAGVMALSVGTSGVVFAPLDHYAYEPDGRLHAFCHAAPGLWHFMGVMLSAAGSLQWYRDTLAPDTDFDVLVAEAGEIPAGSEGLLFLPYLTGERTPHPDPLARGAFVGLTARHTRGHMTRAVLEGVAYGLKDSLTLIAQAGVPDPDEIRVAGGGARSPVWREILADILGAPLSTTSTTEGGAYGAALLAGVGADIYPDIQSACDATITTGDVVEPGADREAYAAGYALYQELYPALRAINHRISAGT